jgi:hypothetical protein
MLLFRCGLFGSSSKPEINFLYFNTALHSKCFAYEADTKYREMHTYTGFLHVTISAEYDSRFHASGNKRSFYTFAFILTTGGKVSDILQMEYTDLQNRK